MLDTSATYVALAGAIRSAPVVGDWFPTAGRTRWRLEANVAELATSVDLAVHIRSVANQTPVLVFTTQVTAEGSFDWDAPGDFDVQSGSTEIRVDVDANVGQYVLAAFLMGPFFDGSTDSPDLVLLSPRLRDYDDVQRIVLEAEDDVLNRPGLGMDLDGRLTNVDMSLPRFADQMRMAISRQAEHLFVIEQMRLSGEEEDLKDLLKTDRIVSDVDRILQPFLLTGAADDLSDEPVEWAPFVGRG